MHLKIDFMYFVYSTYYFEVVIGNYFLHSPPPPQKEGVNKKAILLLLFFEWEGLQHDVKPHPSTAGPQTRDHYAGIMVPCLPPTHISFFYLSILVQQRANFCFPEEAGNLLCGPDEWRALEGSSKDF